MKENQDITNTRYNDHMLLVPWHFAISGFHWMVLTFESEEKMQPKVWPFKASYFLVVSLSVVKWCFFFTFSNWVHFTWQSLFTIKLTTDVSEYLPKFGKFFGITCIDSHDRQHALSRLNSHATCEWGTLVGKVTKLNSKVIEQTFTAPEFTNAVVIVLDTCRWKRVVKLMTTIRQQKSTFRYFPGDIRQA